MADQLSNPENISPETVITAENTPLWQLALKEPVYQELISYVGNLGPAAIVGSWTLALLTDSPHRDPFGTGAFTQAYFTIPGSGRKISPDRCADLDLVLVTSTKAIDQTKQKLSEYAQKHHLETTLKNWRQGPYNGEGQLHQAARIKLTTSQGKEVASVFLVQGLGTVNGWLKNRLFSDEQIALLATTDKVLIPLDPNDNLDHRGRFWNREFCPEGLQNEEASQFWPLTQLGKAFSRATEMSQLLTSHTRAFLRQQTAQFEVLQAQNTRGEPLNNFSPTELDQITAKIATAHARFFANDPVIALHQTLVTHTRTLTLFCPSLATYLGWEGNQLKTKEPYQQRHDALIQSFISRYGAAFYGGRNRPISRPQTFPSQMNEIIALIFSGLDLELTTGLGQQIIQELDQSWPKNLFLDSRWIPLDAPLDFSTEIEENKASQYLAIFKEHGPKAQLPSVTSH
ncbi:hypothetical protein ACFLZP_00780 [Patescibacteria group bacterium]